MPNIATKKTIEVELRSFITKVKYEQLISYFKRTGEYLGKDEQVTYYFSGSHDLRIQKNSKGAKIWLKRGKMHDLHREELELLLAQDDFATVEKLFQVLGFKISIKWFRVRHEFLWRGIKIAVDHTKGYGYILELEKMATTKTQRSVARELADRLSELNIELTPRELFEKQFHYYQKHWRELTV